jgi:hypothetical protein
MSVWMQLDDDRCTGPRTDSDVVREHVALPAAEHSELLAVLTGLVFHLCSKKESA